MKKVLFLVNHDIVIYNFRLEIVERLIEEGYEVHISSPYGEKIDRLVNLGAIYHKIKINRHGINPIQDMAIFKEYRKLFKKIKPDIIFGFTIKPNIYGALLARIMHIPFVANITGLGTAVETPGKKQKILLKLYKIAFKNIQTIFFQNTENMALFRKYNISNNAHKLLPGSGVNLKRFKYEEYPKGKTVKFAFISRIMKEKGIEEYLEAAKIIKSKYSNVEFHICGFCEEEYDGGLNMAVKEKYVIYHGLIDDVSGFMKKMHVIVHPTYYPEGLSNVLLEACSTGRPIITTDRSGCREVVEHKRNGYMIKQRNAESLVNAIEEFITLTYEEKERMGIKARQKVEKEFSREIVVQEYLEQLESLL